MPAWPRFLFSPFTTLGIHGNVCVCECVCINLCKCTKPLSSTTEKALSHPGPGNDKCPLTVLGRVHAYVEMHMCIRDVHTCETLSSLSIRTE